MITTNVPYLMLGTENPPYLSMQFPVRAFECHSLLFFALSQHNIDISSTISLVFENPSFIT